jgi:hypothetical protein
VLRTNIDRDETADHVVRFQGVEFSEWLAMTCYGQIAGSLRKYNRELGVDLERYLMAMYLTGNRPWKKEGKSTLTLSLQYSSSLLVSQILPPPLLSLFYSLHNTRSDSSLHTTRAMAMLEVHCSRAHTIVSTDIPPICCKKRREKLLDV